MRKIYYVVISILLVSNQSTGQTTYTWNGGATGDYQVPANWSPARATPLTTDILSFNLASSVAVTNAPNQTIGAIVVAAGTATVSFATNIPTNVLTLSAAVPLVYTTPGSILAADFLTINLNTGTACTITAGTFGISPSTGGKIAINGSLTLDGGTFSVDIIGTGGTVVNGNLTYIKGNFSCNNTSSLTFAAGSNYYHACNGSSASAIPVAIWATNSTCNITGMNTGTTAPTGLTNAFVFFYNFTWNCPSQSGNVNLLPGASSVIINGTFTVANTGSNELRLTGASGSATVNASKYLQSGGTFTLQAASLATDSSTLSVSGNFNQTAGILNGVGGSSAGTGLLDLKGPVTKVGATWQSNSSSTASQFIVQFTGSTSQTVSISGGWNAPNQGRCNIVINNSDKISGVSLTGTLKVINTASAGLPATCTMRGVITGGGSVTYSGAGTGGTALIYAGIFLQNASAIEYPASGAPASLTINNSLGVNFPANFSRVVPGTLAMISGNLALGSDTLSLTNTSLINQLSYSGGYITTGTLARTFPTAGLPTDTSNTRSLFPFGTGNNNRSLRLYFSSGTLTTGTPGMIYVTHSPMIGVPAISPTILDNTIYLDKRTSTNWNVSTSGFDLGGGGETISMSVVAGNIGSVDNYLKLRLTDGTTSYGTLINTNTGSNAVCATGKSGLTMADINKPVYIGSDGTTSYNPLIIITFNWTGLGGNTDWTNPGNWTGINAVGYPSASTEIAVVTSTSGTQPTIKTTDNISLLQLRVGGGMTLTMVGNSVINVYDGVDFSGGLTSFAPTSTFIYASSNNAQTVLDLPYGSLGVSGTGVKILAPSITVTGNYTVSDYWPAIGTGTFTYDYVPGTGTQKVAAAGYYNLTIKGNRAGNKVTLGPLAPPANTITIANNFVVTATNYIAKSDYNTVDFTSNTSQPIPGFVYSTLKNSGTGPRVLDPLGTTNAGNVISVVNYFSPSGGSTVVGSKVIFTRSSNSDIYGGSSSIFNDLEISGNLTGFRLDFISDFKIAGTFTISATGFTQGTSSSNFYFNGPGNQTIPATYPGFSFKNIFIVGSGSRKIIFEPSATKAVGISGAITVTPTFVAPNGFVTAGSTVNFIGGPTIPVLVPAAGAGTPNYNNVSVRGGTRILEGNMTIGGNLTISGTSASTATLTVGNGATPRTLNVLGNVLIAGSPASPDTTTAQLDLNSNTGVLTTINLADSLTITGNGQLAGTGSANGTVVFNGALPQVQAYKNTSVIKNGPANFKVGTGLTNTYLSLTGSIDLLRSSAAASKSTLTVENNASLDCLTSNVISNGTGNAIFNLKSGATLITANTGGVEGLATNSSNGTIINDATIVKTYNDTASYTFNGNTTIPFPAAITKMANLTIGANVTLNQSAAVSNTLTLQSATTFALSSSNLNLRSTQVSTARIATVPDNANITYGTGRFVVERYFPARRAWRLITAPVTADAGRTVFNSWQMGGATTSNFGTFVTGPGANPATNGLDVSPQNNFSLKVFNPATGLLEGVTDSKVQLLSNTAGIANKPDNIGMFLFVRGDRSTTALFNTNYANTTTIRDTGRVQIHSQSFTLNAAANQWDLIGNPYASPVDITSIISSATNINNQYFWAYDPYINAQDGGYVTMTLLGGVWVPTPANPSVTQDKNIQSSQAIYVQKTTSAPGSIVFDETNKSSQNNLAMFRPLSQPSIFRTNLYLHDSDTSRTLADGTLIAFDDEFSSVVDNGDAAKFGNTKETFYMVRDTKPLAVERRHTIDVNDTIFFKLSKTTQRNYQFEFIPGNMNSTLSAFLEDSYTKTATPVSLTSNSNFIFSVNADAKSAASDRFRIVFKIAGAGPLPVKYSSIKAYQKNKDIAVEWAVENEINIVKYEVEKSNDGVNFSKIGVVAAKGANSINATYGFTDVNPVQGNNFYRIANYNQTGSFEYSRIVIVKIGKTGTGISVYPNPVKGNMIGVSFTNMEQGLYGVKLISTLGQTLMNQQISHNAGSSMETLTPGSTLSTGIYQLEITAPDKKISTVKVIVQ